MFSLHQVFFHFYKKIDNHIHSTVLYVGEKNEAKKYKYKIHMYNADRSGSVSAFFVTCWYLNDVQFFIVSLRRIVPIQKTICHCKLKYSEMLNNL
jgi:hypothetical protein